MELSEQVEQIAKRELREDKFTRDQCLQQMRDWLSKNEDVQDVRTDDLFLLRFLRTKKFSVPLAQQLLLRYLNLKMIVPKVFIEMDFLSSPMKEVFENGYLFVSPIRDAGGRRVIITRTAIYDPYRTHGYTIVRAHITVIETLLEDPINQVVGFSHFFDLKGSTVPHFTIFRPSDYECLKYGEASLPARHKAINFIDVPSTVKWALDIGRRFLSKKLNDRINVYSGWNEFKQKHDTSFLPKELGGKIPMAEMIQWWKQEMVAKRDIVVQLDKMKLLNDRGITKKHDKDLRPLHAELEAHMDSVAGSFRKLEVD